jgi:hypothetical protein
MRIGDIVKVKPLGYTAQVMDILSQAVIVDDGIQTLTKPIDRVVPIFSVGDQVFIKNTNRSFVIDEFVYSDTAFCWKACREDKTSSGFHSDNHQYWFNISNLEKGREN